MPTTKQTIAQWPFERLYVAPFTQKRGFDERSLTYKMVPMEPARQLTGIKVLDTVVDSLIASALRTKAPAIAAIRTRSSRPLSRSSPA